MKSYDLGFFEWMRVEKGTIFSFFGGGNERVEMECLL